MARTVFRALSAVLALVGAAGAACAQTAWQQLTPQQRSVLAPLERDWARNTPSQQQKWLEVTNRYGSLPAEEQARLQQRMADWSRLSPQERGNARLNYQEARQLGRENRQQQWEAYRALPPEQRRALAERAQSGSAPAATLRERRREESAAVKSNVVVAPTLAAPRPVGPTVVQRGAGATTNLVSKPTSPPLHQQAGLPKVVASPGFVDNATLLPQRGAQGAAVRAPQPADGKNGKAPPKKP
jgi:hypothetical protein